MPFFSKGSSLSQIAPAPEPEVPAAAQAPAQAPAQAAAQVAPPTPAAAQAEPAAPESFIVGHEIAKGGYRYSNVTLDTEKLKNFHPYQINLIRCCEELVHILNIYKIQNISITFNGNYVYNNLKILADPAVNADKQKWEITWSAPPSGNTRMLKFNREMIRYLPDQLPAQLQESGGNKRRKNTKGKKIKRKKTKKQTSR
jgi:hypothetical protein